MSAPPSYDDIEIIDDTYMKKLQKDEKEHILNIVDSLLESGDKMKGMDFTITYNGVDIHITRQENKYWKNAKQIGYFIAKQYFLLRYITG